MPQAAGVACYDLIRWLELLDKNTLRSRGLAFGRSLLSALKTAVMYSVNHPAADRLVQQSYTSLNVLLKQLPHFTFGFMDGRVLLDRLLADEGSLKQLEDEFGKRGIATVTFTAGISLQDFKRALTVLATKPKVIEEKGGIQRFLEANPIEKARIQPGKKKQGEDTLLGMDPESFRLAQEILGVKVEAGVSALDVLLQSAGLSKPAGFGGGAGEMVALASRATQAVLLNPEVDTQSLVADLVRALESLTPEHLLSCLPSGQGGESHNRSTEEVAENIVEDIAVGWAVNQLAHPPAGSSTLAVEEDALRVLLRGLKATRVAERLLQKLSHFIAEANLPPEVYDRIRQGMAWYGLSQKEKHAQFMAIQRFSDLEFRRLVEYVREMMKEGKIDEAIQAAEHYLAFLDSEDPQRQKEELTRAPDLLLAMAGPQTFEFLRSVADRLGKQLLDERQLDADRHRQIGLCLKFIAQLFLPAQDLESVHRIGLSLQHSWARNPSQHAACCGKALEQLLTSEVIEELVKEYVEKRDEPVWARNAASLLKLLGPATGELVLQHLEEETVAGNRMRLMSLFKRLGPGGIESARKRLADGRWYVVRNACHLLGQLGDPDLPRQLTGALRHPDIRVQQEAVTAIIKSHAPDRARALAEALPYLPTEVLEATLDELAFLREPMSVDGLVQLLMLKKAGQTSSLEKAGRVLAGISSESERAAEGLGEVLLDAEQTLAVRRIALDALGRNRSAFARQLLKEFARLAPADTLAEEYKQTTTTKAPSSKSR
jgi:HEAT repeat protein